MISSMLLKGAILFSFVFVWLTTALTFPHLEQPSLLHLLKVTIAVGAACFGSLWAYLEAWYLKDCVRREGELYDSSFWGEENPKSCPFSAGLSFDFFLTWMVQLQEHLVNCLTSLQVNNLGQWMWKMVQVRAVSCFQPLRFLLSAKSYIKLKQKEIGTALVQIKMPTLWDGLIKIRASLFQNFPICVCCFLYLFLFFFF